MPVRPAIVSCAAFAALCLQSTARAIDPDEPAPPVATAPSVYRKIRVGIGYHFSSGDYGLSETTTIHYVPLTVTAEISRFRFQVSLPYLHIRGPAGIVDGGPTGTIISDGDGDGLGDLFARASYLLPRPPEWPAWVPFVDLVGVIKFPTASRSDGLGTGKLDVGLESELTWAVGPITPFATIGYRLLGDPRHIELHNVLIASLGAAYPIVATVSAGLELDYRQASSGSTGERVEIVPFAAWEFVPRWTLQLYTVAGLAEGSPDVGVGVQLGYAW
jgi:hypothetical protein